MSPAGPRTALVTGGNRGIGLEVCRRLAHEGLRVLLAGRDPAAIAEAAASLREAGRDVRPLLLDVGSDDSIDAALTSLGADGLHVDVLVNNAGVYPQGSLLETSPDVFDQVFRVNFLGPLRLCRALVPAMQRSGYGRVVNVSSGYGSVAGGLPGPAAYSISKAALNALTIKLASEVNGGVKVNAACPGWVRTRMGGSSAPVSPEEAADTIVWLATLPADGASGGFFRRRQPIPW